MLQSRYKCELYTKPKRCRKYRQTRMSIQQKLWTLLQVGRAHSVNNNAPNATTGQHTATNSATTPHTLSPKQGGKLCHM
jgi:hypothetical protein